MVEHDRETSSVRRSALAMCCVSASLLLLEVSATRLLSFVSWHHFAFMVVSVAMLGLGASSVLLSLSRRMKTLPLGPLSAGACALLAVGVVAAYVVIVEARLFPGRGSEAGGGQHLRLAAIYVGLLLPLLAGGFAMAVTLTRLARRSAAVYGADLLGGAAGCLAGVALAGPLSLAQSFVSAGVLAAAAAAIQAWPSRRLLAVSVAVGALLLGFTVAVDDLLPPRAAEGKNLHHLLFEATPPGRLVETENTPLGRVDLVDTELTMLWSINRRAPAKVPHQLRFVIDGDAATPVAVLDRGVTPRDLEYLDDLPSSFAFALRRPERALVIGAGGGQDVLAALRHEARRVDAVEVNPAIIRMMRGRLLERTGRLYERPDVRVIQAEGRSFVRAADGLYDVVQLGLVDTWAATNAGGLGLTEAFLYTREAFEDYLKALRPGGVVSVTRWIRQPPREVLRLTVIAAAALRELGVEHPERHLAVVGLGVQGTLLVFRDPLTEAEAERLVRLAHERHLDLHLAPHHRSSPSGAFRGLLRPERLEDLVEVYPYDISVVTDDRPFFFDFGNPGASTLASLLSLRAAAQSGRATILAVLLQALVLSFLLLVAPVAVRRVRVGRDGVGLIAFFAFTGAGFMFVEVSLLQRLTLLLGHPTRAVALTFGVLLASSGLAALFSETITGVAHHRLRFALLVLALVATLEAAFGDEASRLSLDAPSWLRPVLAALRVAPLGALMGLATPHGLRTAAREHEALAPLLWATSSFASVIGSILAVGVALPFGFRVSLLVGVCCYLAAAAVVAKLPAAGAE